jgi:hypothetical protein
LIFWKISDTITLQVNSKKKEIEIVC